MNYETVIGLEVHAQLQTNTKLFCSCSTRFGRSPNQNTCEVCLGMPGVLPVLNEKATELAVRAAIGLGCDIHLRSQWARKNYFYPDLSKGYQISQFEHPYCTGGTLTFVVDGEEKTVRLTRIHMEEDAGKSIHDGQLVGNRSCVDFNRGGTPLIEIVSEPDLRSSQEAASYMKTLRQLLRYLGVCDGNMEEGSLRCDANVSIRPFGAKEYGTRTELKNINSFRFVQQAIDYEVSRQIDLLDSGERVVQETRLWDTQAKVTRTMRSKEDAHDYRYFPDPDLPELVVSEEFVAGVRKELPELPAERYGRLVKDHGLTEKQASVLTEDKAVVDFYEAAFSAHRNAKSIANWVINDVLRELKGQDISELGISGSNLGELVKLIDDDVISGKIAKEVFVEMRKGGQSPAEIVDARGLKQVTNTEELEGIITLIIESHPGQVAQYRDGKVNLLGFFVGQVMKQTQGKANPKIVNELLRGKLEL